MRRLVGLLLLVAGCSGDVLLPSSQAARDLGCAEEHVHVTFGLKAQIAEGCGRSLTYVRVCREDAKPCHFEAVRSWAQRGEMR
jgi:hypothetical protein